MPLLRVTTKAHLSASGVGFIIHYMSLCGSADAAACCEYSAALFIIKKITRQCLC